MRAPLILRIFKSGQIHEVKQFDVDQIIIGNEADVQVNLQDPSVSSIHCMIELRDSGYYICDLGSKSGTFKNGNQILDEPLSSGDQVTVGVFTVHFFIGVPKPKAPPVQTAGVAAVQDKEITQPAIHTAEITQPNINKQAPLEATTARINPVGIPANALKPVEKVSLPAAAPAAKGPAPNASTPIATPPQGKAANNMASVGAVMPPVQGTVVPPPKLPGSKKIPGAPVSSRSKKNRKTFAPTSEIKNLREYIKPTKGPVVEVIVAWQERIISSYHFSTSATITMGSDESSDISVPSQFIKGKFAFLELKGGCRVLTAGDMQFEMINSSSQVILADEVIKLGKATKTNTGYALRLDQGEVMCVTLAGGLIEVYIRFIPASPRPSLISPLDFSQSELTGIIASLVIVALMALYVSVYSPDKAEEQKEEETPRVATFIYNKPKPTPEPEPAKVVPPPVEVVAKKPTPTPQVKKIDITDKKEDKIDKGKVDSKNATKEKMVAKAAEVRPNPSKLDRPKKFTSVNHGGAVKISDTAGANAQTAKDVNKTGLLAAFGGGGILTKLDKAASGAGDLIGTADKATGSSGQNENRAGDDIGSKIKDVGAGGKGIATYGIAGVGTKGRSSGDSNYGSGVGIGGKNSVMVDPGGAEEQFTGTIDKEAVRRVIKRGLNQIKSCYERQLRVNSSLEGKVVIYFEIEEQGHVRLAKASSSTLNDPAVESCVAARIKEWRFPEPPVGVVAGVYYPFVFGAQR